MEETLTQTESDEKKPKSLKERIQEVGTGIRGAGKWIANQWDWYDMNSKCVYGAIFAGVMTAYIVSMEKFVSQPIRERQAFSEARQEVLLRYGDSNKDGYVSQAEEDALFADILSGRGVKSLPGERPFYEDGKIVPRTELTFWINDYMASKKAE
jgi:hypothetical protein